MTLGPKFREQNPAMNYRMKISQELIGEDQKGIYKRGIHDQGDFWKFLLEVAV